MGNSTSFELVIDSSCGPGYMSCQDGTCLPFGIFCDGKFDCYDKSDESQDFCPCKKKAFSYLLTSSRLKTRYLFISVPSPSVIATPESIITAPWHLIRFYCISPEGLPLNVMFSANHQPVKNDPRYLLRRVNGTTLEIVVPQGLRGPEDSTQIE